MSPGISHWEHKNNVQSAQKAIIVSLRLRVVNSVQAGLTVRLDQQTVRHVKRGTSARALGVNILQINWRFYATT